MSSNLSSYLLDAWMLFVEEKATESYYYSYAAISLPRTYGGESLYLCIIAVYCFRYYSSIIKSSYMCAWYSGGQVGVCSAARLSSRHDNFTYTFTHIPLIDTLDPIIIIYFHTYIGCNT